MSLLDTVQQLNKECESKKEDLVKQRQDSLQEKRAVAKSMALAELLKDYQNTMKESAQTLKKDNTPRKEARLYVWSYKDAVTFNGCYLLDLFKKGGLTQELQEFIDEKEGKDCFKVYWASLFKSKPKMKGKDQNQKYVRKQDQKYGLFISWDKEDWPRITEMQTRRSVIRSAHRETSSFRNNKDSNQQQESKQTEKMPQNNKQDNKEDSESKPKKSPPKKKLVSRTPKTDNDN